MARVEEGQLMEGNILPPSNVGLSLLLTVPELITPLYPSAPHHYRPAKLNKEASLLKVIQEAKLQSETNTSVFLSSYLFPLIFHINLEWAYNNKVINNLVAWQLCSYPKYYHIIFGISLPPEAVPVWCPGWIKGPFPAPSALPSCLDCSTALETGYCNRLFTFYPRYQDISVMS